MADKKKVTILFSGGIDSTACLSYYRDKGYSITPLYVDFNQPAKRKELNAAKSITRHYKLKLQILKVEGFKRSFKGEIQGRNIFLVSVAYMLESQLRGIIAMGIHSGTEYVDCSPAFVKQTNNILSLYSNGKVFFEAPFLKFLKNEILEYCLLNKIPLHLTYSCELGLNQPCGKCLSCKDLKRIYDRTKYNS